MTDEFENEIDDVVPNDGELPRRGELWVRMHNHQVLAPGEASRPEGKGIVKRTYFDNLNSGIESWGKYLGAPHKSKKAIEYLDMVCDSYNARFHECFFVNEGSPSSYLAIALTTSGHAGRMWLHKTVIHFLRPFPGTVRLAGPKNVYSFHFSDFVDKAVPVFVDGTKTPVCKFTNMALPLSLICDCGNPECEYYREI